MEDAAQDVFIECFKTGGVLRSADRDRGPFRGFFFSVVRNVARRYEEKHRPNVPLPTDAPDLDESVSQAFDRAWVRSTLREAARVQAEMAEGNDRAIRRVELLRLRFQEQLPIREIAERWGADAAFLHHEYAIARKEFRAALIQVLALHHPGASEAELNQACVELVEAG